MAAKMRRQGGHPEATGSNRFERYVTGRFHGLHCCVKTPFLIFLIFIYKQLEWLIGVRQGKGWGLNLPSPNLSVS